MIPSSFFFCSNDPVPPPCVGAQRPIFMAIFYGPHLQPSFMVITYCHHLRLSFAAIIYGRPVLVRTGRPVLLRTGEGSLSLRPVLIAMLIPGGLGHYFLALLT